MNIVDMSDEFHRLVGDFMVAFDASRDLRLWTKLIEEEVKELDVEVLKGDKLAALKEAVDIVYVVSGADLVTPHRDGAYSQADMDRYDRAVNAAEAIMSIYTGTFQTTGFIFREAFLRVHASNMSKLDDNGQPIRREDGKILKGPNYRAPDLTNLV